MSVRLFDYNYVVQYLPGVKNTVADFLSRMPLPSNDTDEFQNSDEDGKDDMWVAIVEEGVCNGIMRDEWNTEQNLDEVMKELSIMITKGEKICSVGKCPPFSNAVREEFHTRLYVFEAFENGGTQTQCIIKSAVCVKDLQRVRTHGVGQSNVHKGSECATKEVAHSFYERCVTDGDEIRMSYQDKEL
ncbi:hypothetical protein NDU88_012473 [Pleurodeles waltl]|uniref:Uncharacterized protein n=1 Tax=Pleurodeles waltl TaxID=8319 RepID=A0AAV7R611_PLEWA|nr:hypothetical protein NDU88_012473 [Pleurodeles waltl]